MHSRLMTDATSPLHSPPTAAATTTPRREIEIAPTSRPGGRRRPRPAATTGASRAAPTARALDDLRSRPSTFTASRYGLATGSSRPGELLSHDVYPPGRRLKGGAPTRPPTRTNQPRGGAGKGGAPPPPPRTTDPAPTGRAPLPPSGGRPPAAVEPLPPGPAHALKRLFLGPALPTAQLQHERLGKPTALAVFASDNLSSVAYATEETLKAAV